MSIADEPRSENESDEDPLEELIRSKPPATFSEIGEYATGYMAALEAIAEGHADDPLQAAQQTIIATMRLVAGLSPPGSPGPAHVLLSPLLEAVMEMQRGEPPSLLRYGPARDPARHHPAPHIVMGRALAAAVLSLLMEGGMARAAASQLVARHLDRKGVRFAGTRRNPSRTVVSWREQAKDPYSNEWIRAAYRETYRQLAAQIAALSPKERQSMLLRALDFGVAHGMFPTR